MSKEVSVGKLRVNDKFEVDWQPGMTIRDVIRKLNFTFPMLVVTVNGKVVPKEDWDTYELREEDNVRILHMIAGG